MSNLVQIVKDVKAANRNDLLRMLVSIQTILDAAIEFQERMNSAPLAVKLYLEEHHGDVNSLNSFQNEIHAMITSIS